MTTLAIIGVLVLLFIGWLVREVRRAPVAYEDPVKGFCLGEDPRHQTDA